MAIDMREMIVTYFSDLTKGEAYKSITYYASLDEYSNSLSADKGFLKSDYYFSTLLTAKTYTSLRRSMAK